MFKIKLFIQLCLEIVSGIPAADLKIFFPILLFQFFFSTVLLKSNSHAPCRRVILPLSDKIQNFAFFVVLNLCQVVPYIYIYVCVCVCVCVCIEIYVIFLYVTLYPK